MIRSEERGADLVGSRGGRSHDADTLKTMTAVWRTEKPELAWEGGVPSGQGAQAGTWTPPPPAEPARLLRGCSAQPRQLKQSKLAYSQIEERPTQDDGYWDWEAGSEQERDSWGSGTGIEVQVRGLSEQAEVGMHCRVKNRVF